VASSWCDRCRNPYRTYGAFCAKALNIFIVNTQCQKFEIASNSTHELNWCAFHVSVAFLLADLRLHGIQRRCTFPCACTFR
jgi:hypothetical protein